MKVGDEVILSEEAIQSFVMRSIGVEELKKIFTKNNIPARITGFYADRVDILGKNGDSYIIHRHWLELSHTKSGLQDILNTLDKLEKNYGRNSSNN